MKPALDKFGWRYPLDNKILTVASFMEDVPTNESVFKKVDVPTQFKVTEVNPVQFWKAFVSINVTSLGIVIVGSAMQPEKQLLLTDFKLV